MKKITSVPPSNLSILIRRIVAFGVDLAFSSLVSFIVVLPILDELSRWITKPIAVSDEHWLTDPGEAYILFILFYSLAFIPLLAMPFRFLFRGKSLGSLLMKIQIQKVGSNKTANFRDCLLRSPALLVLSTVGALQYVNSGVLDDLYRRGPYEYFLDLHFLFALVSGLGLVLLLGEWIWVFVSKDLRSPGERWTKTEVAYSKH